MKTQKFVSKIGLLAVVAGVLLVSTGANAKIIFQADYKGPGVGTGGANDMVTLGGTGAIIADNINMTAAVTHGIPFTPLVTNYLNIQRIANVGGGSTPWWPIALTFASATNSFSAWQGPNIPNPNPPGDGTYTNFVAFHGAFDCFFRIDSTVSGDSDCFRPIDPKFTSENTGDLYLLINGLPSGGFLSYLSVQNFNALIDPPPIINYTLVNATLATAQNYFYLNSYLGGGGTYSLAAGQIYHFGLTLNTDTNGLSTVAMFIQAGTGAIDTSTNNAISYITFNLDAAEVTNAFPSSTWFMEAGWGQAAPWSIDYSTTRLYDSAPATFAALPGTPVPPTNGVVFRADYDGPGTGEGGGTNMVTFGGTLAYTENANFIVTNSVGLTNAVSFAPGSGNYEDIYFVNSAGNTYPTYIPDNAASSFNSWVGPNITNGANVYLNLNGSYDIFVRLNQTLADANWLTPLYLVPAGYHSGTGGLAINWSGTSPGGTSRVQFFDGDPAGFQNFTRVFGTTGSTSAGSTLFFESPLSDLYTNAGTWHIGFTFSTDTNGLVTAKLFGVSGTGAIDTTTTNNLEYEATFTINANTAAGTDGSPLLGHWLQGGSALAGSSVDYARMSVWQGAASSFPALVSAPPGFLPPTVSGGNITLSWTNSGTLLWSTNVLGPWVTNTSATASPYSEPIVPNQNRFYRLKQ